jgi:UV DNA damage endonuclease
MGCGPEAVIVLHVGGAVGGRDAAFDRFEDGLSRMGARGRARLVIENDDRSFSLTDVLELHGRTGLPVVWDILHHHCHDPERIPDVDALRLALGTWEDGVVPKIHWSTGKPEKLRAHADYLDPIAFDLFLRGPAAGLEFDVMLEAKAKDLALRRLREHLVERGFVWEFGRVGSPKT